MRDPGAIQRLARHRLLWGGLTLLCLLGLLAARVGEDRAYQAQVEAAVERATSATSEVVADRTMTTPDGGLEISPQELLIALQAELFVEPAAGRLRVYDAEGSLVFSTDESADGEAADPLVKGALRGETGSRAVREPFTRSTTGMPGVPTDLVAVAIPLRLAGPDPVGVVRVDYLEGELRAAASGPWPAVQLTLAICLLLCSGLAVVGWVPSRSAPEDLPAAEEGSGAVEPSSLQAEVGADDPRRDELQVLQAQLAATEEALRDAEAEARRSPAVISTPVGSEPTAADLLDELVRRVEIAEERTREAEERLAEAGAGAGEPLPEPGDLRERLTRAAAHKRPRGDAAEG